MTEADRIDALERNGIASLSDLESRAVKTLREQLDRDQTRFRTYEPGFATKAYPWPRAPLHWWSRVWEYPYVFHAVQKWLSTYRRPGMPHVVDHGSGVTFFPFSMARMGCRITCTDIDQVCQPEIDKARELVDHTPGTVAFRHIDGSRMPFGSGEVDCVYSVSVIEHLHNIEECVADIARILHPEGMLVLTCDLDLRGDERLGVEDYSRLRSALENWFIPLYPERSIHPLDMLTSERGPYALQGPKGPRRVARVAADALRDLLLARTPTSRVTWHLAVLGMAWIKRTDGPRRA